jgi:uncharacterized protein
MSLAVPISLSRAQARSFLVRRHLLGPPRSLPAEPASVMRVIDRLGFLQFDPLDVPGARNHDLVLHARIGGYRREWLDELLYGPDRQLIELYNKSLNIVPLSELPHYRLTWDRNAPDLDEGILRRESSVAEAILERIAREGPLSTAAFAEHGHAVDWWWAPTRAARAVLEALFVSGRVGISRRDGNRRYFDLIERLVPAELLSRRESKDDAMRHRLLSRLRAGGLASLSGSAELTYGTGTAAERARHTAELVEAGAVAAVAVEGLKATRYAVADELPLLEDHSPLPPAVTFVAPVDPLVAVRRATQELWDFDYRWEIFVPPARRVYGYYVLPILFADRLVGRIEPRFDRRAGVLSIVGLWWEEGFSPRREEGLVPAMRAALADYLGFVGARRLEWSTTIRPAGRLFGSVGRGARTTGGGAR